MKILVINNITDFLSQIKKVLREHEVRIVEYNSIEIDDNNFDLILLTGGHSLSIENHAEKYEREIGILMRTNLPVFGICLGFEIICHTFMEKLEKLEKKEHGISYLNQRYQDPIFHNLPGNFDVFESHLWCLKAVKTLLPLAQSKDGIEIVKHPTKLIYGVQFHPERFINKIHGYQILKNFIEIVERTKGLIGEGD